MGSQDADSVPLESLTPDGADPDQPTPMPAKDTLVAAGLVMAAGTMVSRVLGFGRALMIALVLGVLTRQGDMFTIANTVPNSIYILLAGGALNTVFVPQIVRAIKHDEDRGEAYTNRILTATLLGLTVITVAVTALAPAIIWLYTNSDWHTAALAPQLHSMVMLAYLCLPQIFFYGAYTLVGQVLNARGVFGPMMWAPLVNNVIAIAVLGFYLLVWGAGGDPGAAFTLGQELTLGIGATVGIAAQAAILIPFMHRAGFRYRPRFDLRGTGLGHTFSLARWTFGFVLVTQLGVLVLTRLASGATVSGEGAGWNAYNQAYLLWILPHSLVTVSLVTAMLPHASSLAADGDDAGVRTEATRTIRLAMSAVVPVTAAFIALAMPLASILLGWGPRSAGATAPVAWTLIAFAIGLVPFTVQYVCQRTFYAMEDTRTPFLQQCLIVLVNVLVAIALVLPFHRSEWIAPALALSYSFAYVVGVIVSFRTLAVRLPGLPGLAVLRHGLVLLLAVAPATVAAWAISWGFGHWSTSQPVRLLGLVVAGLVAVPLFIAAARLLRIAEVTEILAPILRRVRPARPADANTVPTGAGTASTPSSSPILKGRSHHAQHPDEAATMKLDSSGQDASVRSAAGAGGAPGDPDQPGQPGLLFSTDPSLEDTQPTHDPIGVPRPQVTDDPEASTAHPELAAGQMLGDRYRLEEVMAERRNIATWRAFDEVLSRSVVCHIFQPGDPQTDGVMAAARRSAIATDSRFLRVLDAVQAVLPPDAESDDGPGPDPQEIGSYVVCEYAPGQSLQTLLAHGPLTALESAWVVREVADAMAGVHSAGLFHQRLNPDTIIITPSGNVKIVGLLLEAALSTLPGPSEPSEPAILRRGRLPGQPDSDSSDDVADLGRLLYACLVQRWPGGNLWGLAPAPADGHDGWMSPHQVRAGVSPVLDRICDQILHSRTRTDPIRTAHGVVNALTKVLGTADASADLERRLRQPVPVFGGEPGAATSPASAFWAQQESADSPASPPTPPTRKPNGRPPHPGVVDRQRRQRPPRRRWIGVLVLIIVLAMLALLSGAVIQAVKRTASGPPGAPASGGTSASASAGSAAPPLSIVAGDDFDPTVDGGSGDENSDQVGYAFDHNPKTRWQTVTYKDNITIGTLKPGVGIVLDLGATHNIANVQVSVFGTGSTVQLRVPSAAGATEAPTSQKQWKSVAQETNATGTVTLTPKTATSSRYLLLYFTKLAPDRSTFRAGIYEVVAEQ